MARVDIPGVGPVEFDNSLSDAEILDRARAIQAKAKAPLFDPRDLSTSDLIKGGFSRGIEGLKGTAFDLIPALAGSALGFKPYAKEQLQEYRDRMAAEEELHPTAYKGFSDIQGAGDIGGFIAETAGELAPDIASFLLGTGVGTYAGKKLATKVAGAALKEGLPAHVAKRQLAEEAATKLEERVLSKAAATGADIGGKVGLFGTSMAQSIPETFNSIYEETGDLAPGLAITFGSLKGALDTYLPSKILKQLGPAGKDRIAAAMLDKSTIVPPTWKKAFITEAFKTTGGEALTESAQQAIDLLAGKVAGSKDPFFSQKNIDSILFSGLKGAVGGGTFGAPGAAMEASRIKQAAIQEDARRQMLQQQEAEKQRQEQEQRDQQELARRQQETGDLFGEKVPEGPGIPSRTVAEKERAADPIGAMIGDLVQQFQSTKSPIEQAAIAEKLKRIEDSLPAQSHEKQMLLDLLGPLLGYTPGKAYPTQSIDTTPITVDQQGVARTPEQAEAERLTPQEIKGYQPDMFEKELNLAQAQEKLTGREATPYETLASIKRTEDFSTVLSPDLLQRTGLKPQSGFFKKLLNKDLSNPDDQAAVRDILVQVRQNPNIAESTKQAIESVAMQAFAALGQQTNMVGPRGGIRRDVNYGTIQPRPSAVEADRTSVQVPDEQVSEPTERVGTPEQQGLGPTGGITSESGNGEAVQPDTLTEETVEAPAKTEVTEPDVQAAATEEVAAETPVEDTETIEQSYDQNPKMRQFLEDHVLQLKADYRLSKDPAAKAAIKEEIEATERDLREGKYQAGETRKVPEENKKLIKDTLRKELDKLGLKNTMLQVEQLFPGQAGMQMGNVILVGLGRQSISDYLHTVHHEAIHALKRIGVFTPQEWKMLENMSAREWVKKYNVEKRWKAIQPDITEEAMLEEGIAEAFADYMQQPKQVQTIIQKVVNFLKALRRAFMGNGFTTPESLFQKVSAGRKAPTKAQYGFLPPNYKSQEEFDKYLDMANDTMITQGPVSYQATKDAAKEVFTGMDKVIRDIPGLKDNQKAALSEGINRAGGAAKSAILSLLPMHALGEVANEVFPGLGSKFNQYINERSGYQDKLNRGTDAVIEEAKKAIAAKPEQRDAYNKLVNTSTVEEVDPTKPRSEYVKDKDKLAAWDKLNPAYNKLDKVWKDLYVTMRDGYKQMYEEVKKAINERIDGTTLDAPTKSKLKADIMAKLAEKGMIEPYFALGREGSHWLASEYVDRSGQKQFTVEAFKSDYERKIRQEQLLKEGATRSDPYESLDKIDYRRAPANSFVNSVLNIMETNKVDQKAIDEMMRLFLTTLPETAFAKSFQKRKGTAGYMEDTIGVFERKMRNTAHQVANMVYNPKLTGVVDAMEEQTTVAGESGEGNAKQVEYVNEFKKHLSYVLSPTKNDIGSILTSAAFTYTLGFNLSSALVNMANVPMIVAPYLKGKYADSNVARALGDAAKLFTGSGTKTNMPVIGGDGRTTGMRVMPSITNYAPDSEMGKKYATLIRIGNEQGQFNRSQLYEIINGDTRTGVMAKFNAMSGWMFHHGERMNREVTMVATYNLEMERLKKAGITGPEAEVQAANHAIYTTELTNGGISAAAAPRVAQNPIGKMFFMYKRYGVSMYYMMFKTAKEALKGETKEARQAAMKQLGGIVGMSALMAGAQGIPMFGALSLVYSLFTDDDEDDLDAVTQKALGDFLYKGPVEYATNLAIAGRITLNDLIIRDAPKGSATTFSQQVLQALGGPVFGVADRIQRGYSKMNEGNIERAMEDLLPSAIANGFKAYRYATEGTKTLRGDPITGEVSMYNAVGQLFGFAPADYTRQLEINAREKGIDKTVNERASKQKQKYYIAKREGDFEGMQDAKDKLLEIGEKHPGLGINPSTVNDIISRSMKAQERATKEMINGVRYNKKRLKEVQSSLAEYED